MLKHLYLIFIATFILGFLTGVVIYLQGNTGKESNDVLPAVSKGFVVTASQYGGTGGILSSSFRVLNTGAYTYIVRPKEGNENRYEGTLSKTDRDALERSIKTSEYASLLGTKFEGVCPIEAGGFAYRYTITYNGQEFAFDSCKQDLVGQALFEMLNTYFDILSTQHSTAE